MERTESLRFLSAIDALHAVRRDVSALKLDTQTELIALPAHDAGSRASALRFASARLGGAWNAIDDAIQCLDAALTRLMPPG